MNVVQPPNLAKACGGVAATLVATMAIWITYSVHSLSVDVAKIKTELGVVKPADVLNEVQKVKAAVRRIEYTLEVHMKQQEHAG